MISMFRTHGTLVMALFALLQLRPLSATADQLTNKEKLYAHSAEFRKEIIKVTDGVYVASGYGTANSTMIVGNDGVIIVETMGNETEARAVKDEFDKITTLPVKAIIYTHEHGPVVSGVRVFMGDGQPDIYAHEKVLKSKRPTPVWRPRQKRGGGDQFGLSLSEEERPNLGIAPRVSFGPRGYIEPNRTFSGEHYMFEVAGVRVELYYAPGETDNNIFVWLPRKKVLLPGDDFYKAFPNVYTIRGSTLRRADLWIESLAKMIAKKPEYLVPSHTRPILGGEKVDAALSAYHDGLKSIYDQTVIGMREGLRPDELVEVVKLPPELAENPYLQEYYGMVAWTVKAIYSFHLGWFDGNATNLFPLSNKGRAARIVELTGGPEVLLNEAHKVFKAGDFQWAAELVDYVLALDERQPEAMKLKVAALREMAETQINAGARNYYLTSAKWLEERIPKSE